MTAPADPRPAVLVLGGGVAGLQAGIDLASLGFRVHLVERNPSIGGRMAQLDKTFPTNDCAICILAPKMNECAGHENVEVWTHSEVIGVTGQVGAFRVSVRRRPTYVEWDKCTACGECAAKCPKKVPDEFNAELSKRRAIYMPFPQAVPRKVTVDAEACVYLQNREKGACRLCEDVCPSGAIDWDQTERIVELEVAAIVVATGFDPYDVSALREYGFDAHPNEITGLQYERLISASGPTGGELRRPSDGEHVKRLAFIQCVGSRDVNTNAYCSSVCCMFATKEAILANEHDAQVESSVFYTDLRAGGKGFQEYLERAKAEYRVRFVRGRPAVVGEEEGTRRPRLRYDDTVRREVKETAFDLVVLCQAMVPARGQAALAQTLGIELDEHRFVQIPSGIERPVDTSVEGIFACGFCQSPLDIPDAVTQASGVAARVAEVLMERVT